MQRILKRGQKSILQSDQTDYYYVLTKKNGETHNCYIDNDNIFDTAKDTFKNCIKVLGHYFKSHNYEPLLIHILKKLGQGDRLSTKLLLIIGQSIPLSKKLFLGIDLRFREVGYLPNKQEIMMGTIYAPKQNASKYTLKSLTQTLYTTFQNKDSILTRRLTQQQQIKPQTVQDNNLHRFLKCLQHNLLMKILQNTKNTKVLKQNEIALLKLSHIKMLFINLYNIWKQILLLKTSTLRISQLPCIIQHQP
ncbi:unnamed protein product [Paramecium pentaurelia]|uniref:Uncharacterized protein n=1 Tax=Paramecium pentaurelia TaxID=43138 RepID=A0A8S1TQL0_9CILI|nr:unnamed protein product [Paramecium pentaurelia]